MVLAGPGSGKTFVIVHRILHLIQSKAAAPQNILVLTFSRKAAREMEARFHRLLSERGKGEGSDEKGEDREGAFPAFGTFHSVFFSILRKAYGYRKNQIITESERFRLVKRIIEGRYADSERYLPQISRILLEIARIKQEKGTGKKAEKAGNGRREEELFGLKLDQIFAAYEEGLAAQKKVDFEDMLWMTEELLAQRQDIRFALQKRFSYVLVDEFQDINPLQYAVLKQLTENTRNLTVVGDDDQSIYRFRGAKPEMMLDFHQDFPGCRRVLLDINFRSTREIVEASSRLIAHNSVRIPKEFTAFRGGGAPVEVIEFSDTSVEAAAVCSDILDYGRRGIPYSDVAVLSRTNRQSLLLAAVLSEKGIPYFLGDEMPSLFTHWIARDVLSYFRLAAGVGELSCLWRIANRPNRRITREAFAWGDGLDGLIEYYPEMSYSKRRVELLAEQLKRMGGMKPTEALAFLRREVGYDEFIHRSFSSCGEDFEEAGQILEELGQLAAFFGSYDGLFAFIESFGGKSVPEKAKEKWRRKAPASIERQGAALLTFHAAKGLEFPVVYILDVNEGICPYKKAISREEMEEERRCLYVAMTRARDRLHICTCKSHFYRERKPSIFLREITNI